MNCLVVRTIVAFLLAFASHSAVEAAQPNVLVIITDDQGFGDLGFHGNPKVRTTHLDQLARESVRVKYFYVSPVCAPTRASLMTGRYNYRTGVTDTYLGRAMMFTDEVTLAEMFAAAKYRTGIFGKWHLGDNFPMRPHDQGFQEALVHKGGGIGQPSDPPGGDSYFDPTLYRNGKEVKAKGYCTEVFTDAAIEFVRTQRGKPFFGWVAYNAPHTPLQVPDVAVEPYRKMNLAQDQFPQKGHSLPGKGDQEMIAKVYGMVSNIDENVGRLLRLLDELRIANDTIVVFLTDNGPQQVRYNAGMFERKGSVHEGGIRVPFFVRWPGKLQPGREVDRIAAHIDLAPTLLEACGIKRPADVRFDGRSLWPLLAGHEVTWPDRTLYFQWHRGDIPEVHRAFAARSQRYKLLQPLGSGEKWDGKEVFKLYDMEKDPLEMRDISGEEPQIVQRMLKGYEDWFAEVKGTRNFALPKIQMGSPKEKSVVLTRQDWRGPNANWTTNGLGYWDLEVTQAVKCDITLIFPRLDEPAEVSLILDNRKISARAQAGVDQFRFNHVNLQKGPLRLEGRITRGPHDVGAHYVRVRW